MKMLMKTTEVYRVDSEDEAVKLLDKEREFSLTSEYTLTKSGYVLKNKKSKGEIIETWAVCTIEKTFNE